MGAAQSQLPNHANIDLLPIETDDAWLRDYGPTFLVSDNPNQPSAVDWQYNAWGGKYPPFDRDQKAASEIARRLRINLRRSSLYVEGGALEINETGILLTTRSCILNPNRNPGWTIGDVEAELIAQLGATSIVWFAGHSIPGDDTDGHVDQLARFVSDHEIVYSWTTAPRDPRRNALAANLESLKQSLAEQSLKCQLTPLPLPAPIKLFGEPLPASYTNFLITNELVLVPQFDDPHDEGAVQLLADRFPTRQVIGLPSIQLSVGLGSFHCLSQQQPATGR